MEMSYLDSGSFGRHVNYFIKQTEAYPPAPVNAAINIGFGDLPSLPDSAQFLTNLDIRFTLQDLLFWPVDCITPAWAMQSMRPASAPLNHVLLLVYCTCVEF